MPEVSFVLSVYNGAAALGATLRSVLDQAGCEFEVIAVDDGSTDGSDAVLDKWAARDGRLRVIHQENQGLTRALIRGCGQACGELIARQDVGDVSLPGRMQAQARLLRARPDLAFVGCGYTLVGPADEPLVDAGGPPKASVDGIRNRDGRVLPGPHHGTVMIRKSAFEAAGGYRSEFYFAQDVDLWSRLIEQGDLGHVPETLYRAKFDLSGITARHRPAQQQLRALAAEASALRARGESEAEVLVRAARIRPEKGRSGSERSPDDQRVAAAYFVGSCLARSSDPRGKQYLLEAVQGQPLHLKAWYKLLYLSVLGPKARP